MTAGGRRILVVGAGAMGSQIAMLCALAGHRTEIFDVSADAYDAALAALRGRVERMVVKGRLTDAEADEAFSRLAFVPLLEDGAATADLVVEAATERLDVKRDIFTRLGAAAPAHAVLTTNSSTLASSRLAEASGRPDRLCNMHFFNPALQMACVEVVRNPETSDDTVDTVLALARELGKQPVLVQREVPGFIANRLMGAVQKEALALYAEGVASFEDIDATARGALNHPMGPFELMDLVGLDVTQFIAEAIFAETGAPEDAPSPLVGRLVDHGKLGRKSGEGWYRYG
ncbi:MULTISPECIES: 3-hydroxyacyl-CoA dehydrogenase family protein [Arthrobacter]|uniref:3-hydroxyacyl-CoA dehydrogenase family protein n=2 Tax=Arthrobacter TaxID=1663 RepID=A0ABU9KNH6_9MICC|nr:3-hydroxyacyl-CoA dehydrogenase family protein [Arthrobacter sp. YJM1]MDP5228516.1 3-hydroxyacyl-CoA dehydrogenase family protein [Arthrobacter sp. YJM1]